MLDHEDKQLMTFVGGLKQLLVMFPDKIPPVIQENVVAFSLIQSLHDASSYAGRLKHKVSLNTIYGIDVSNPNVDVWVNLGAPDIY